MRPALIAAAAAVVLGVLPATASGQTPAAVTTTDVRCLIVSVTLAHSDDPQIKAVGFASLLYFWGRLEGRGAAANVAPQVVAQARTMSVDDIKTQAQTCNALVTSAGQSIQDLGATLQKELGGAAQPAPAPGS
jgi:hypothetical protein